MHSNEVDELVVRILVVDDNKDVADSYARLLNLLGHQAVNVYNGHSALECATYLQPHVVLLDINLPDLPGYEVAKQLRARAATPVTIVGISGWMKERRDDLLAEAGFDGYLVKPPPVADLVKFFPAGAPTHTSPRR